jgi:thioredoxin family protein
VLGVGLTLGPVGAGPALAAAVALDLVVLGAIWLAVRPGRPDIRSKVELERVLRGGRPVVVELYSNFCLICMANRRTIKVAATTLSGAATFVRIEVPTEAGETIGEAYGVRYTPSYLLFDERGDLVRTIVPDNVTPIANGYRLLDPRGALLSRLPKVTPQELVDLVRTAA